jgi:hypothetical protein
MAVKKPTLSELLSEPPMLQDGVLVSEPVKAVTTEEANATGVVHVWTENPEHDLGRLHPDFKPQAPNPDCVGYSNE